MMYSILLCTFNGALRLPATLKHLAALAMPLGIKAELLVVNNASSDETDKVVKETWVNAGSPFKLHLFNMPTIGKGHALAMGISKAKGDYVIICDDDNWLSEDYLQEAEKYLTKHTEASILAGMAVAVADNPLPEWFAEKQWAYACGQQPAAAGNTTGIQLLWSAGMILQRDLAHTIFNGPVPMLLLGRTGKQLVSGEDDEICYRAWLLGKETHYVPTLCFKHYMAPHRLNRTYLENLIAGFNFQSKPIGAYWRLYDLVRYKGNPQMLMIKKWLVRQLYRIKGNLSAAAQAADTLYFLTGNRRWQTPENEQVKRFYDEVVKIKFSVKQK